MGRQEKGEGGKKDSPSSSLSDLRFETEGEMQITITVIRFASLPRGKSPASIFWDGPEPSGIRAKEKGGCFHAMAKKKLVGNAFRTCLIRVPGGGWEKIGYRDLLEKGIKWRFSSAAKGGGGVFRRGVEKGREARSAQGRSASSRRHVLHRKEKEREARFRPRPFPSSMRRERERGCLSFRGWKKKRKN